MTGVQTCALPISKFTKLPTGEYFSSDPGQPVKQQEITDPFQYIRNQGWKMRIVDDLPAVLAKLKKLSKKDPSVRYGAEGMNLEENFADGRGPGRPGDSKRHGIKKGVTLAQLDRIVHSKTASPRKKQLAHWAANMRRGRAKKK